MTIYEQYLKARAAIKNPPLDSVNPHFNNKFASLGATLDAVNAACREQGIVYQQTCGILRPLDAGDATQVIVTRIVNEQGETLNLSTLYLPMVDNPQQAGSDLTYRKRQVAQLDWGIVGEVDDDGEAAVAPKAKPAKKRPEKPKQPLEEVIKAQKVKLMQACRGYAQRHNRDEQEIIDGVKMRPDYQPENLLWLERVTEELNE